MLVRQHCQQVLFCLAWFGICHISSTSSSPSAVPIDMGTTLVAIKYGSGVVVAADSRTSVSGYVSHRYASKIVPVSNDAVICRSGSAADTQRIAIETQEEISRRMYRYGINLSISQIAHWIRSVVYGQNGSLSVSLIVAGYDHEKQAARIFSITPSGALIEENVFVVAGSGSTYVLGHLDHNLSPSTAGKTDDLTESAAVSLCKQAIELAIHRDGSSGGLVRLFVIDSAGRRELTFPPCSAVTSNKHANNDKENSPRLFGFAAPERTINTGSSRGANKR